MDIYKPNREECIQLIREMYKKENRLPKKSDFSEIEVAMIKSYFGAWPRALETAGVKKCRNDDIIDKRKEKRIRAKRNKTKYKMEKKNQI